MQIAKMLLFSAGVKVHKGGTEHVAAMDGKSYIVVSNHVTTLDPPIIIVGINRYDFRVVYSLRATSKVPFIGKFVGMAFDSLGWISIKHNENDATTLKRVINRARKDIKKQGYTHLGIFPEGWRTEDGKIQEFQEGTFYLSLILQIPIIPVLMQGVHAIHRHHTFGVSPGEVSVQALEPIYPPKVIKGKMREQAEELRLRVHKLYKDLPDMNQNAHAYRDKYQTGQ